MERRTFVLSGVLGMRAMGANDRVNVGVVGVGSRGKEHVNQYCNLPNARVAAVCDVDSAQTERAVQIAEKAQGTKPKVYQDLRKLYEDKEIDAVSIATPNHWHALAAIWACQAGKDVYVEKPACYNVFEGQQMVAAARKYKRIVQVGMQGRSEPHKRRAMELLKQGTIGQVYMARGICYRRRPSIGHKSDSPVPAGVNWDLFLGPAPMRPFNELRFHYNWHWFWDTGNGDIGNQGIHEMDLARWGFGRALPKGVVSTGGKYVYQDDQETPNTQITTYDYGDGELVFEVRGLNTCGEASLQPFGKVTNYTGVIFFGSKGYLSLDDFAFEAVLGDNRQPGERMAAPQIKGAPTAAHMANFLAAVKSRNYRDLHAEIEEGAISADLVHLANISYRTGRKLAFDPAARKFMNDAGANLMLSRPKYREPYVVPAKV